MSRSELIVALDVAGAAEVMALIDRLPPEVTWYKIGLELFCAEGPSVVQAVRARGKNVFLDLKLHDIPNTVSGAAAEAARLGADLITVHAAGGEAMIRAAVEGIATAGGITRVVAVTLLTSLDPAAMPPGFPRPLVLADVQAEMLALTERAGALGIVCSAADLPALCQRHPAPFYSVTPGIRAAGSAAQDQKRVATIADAVAAGASLLVLGRAITAAADPRAALHLARAERDRAAALVRSAG